MRDTAFIVTKPLQILVALSIIKQLDIRDKTHLVIVDSFFNANLVYQRMKSIDWDFSELSVKFCKSVSEAYQFVGRSGVKKFFIDADVGVRKFLSLVHLKIKCWPLSINVYEEGLGTYRADLYSGIKKTILDLMGIGTQFGGCALTNCLYLYDPEAYRENFPKYKKKLNKISSSPVDTILLYFTSLSHIFDHTLLAERASDSCHIYLSTWHVDYNFIEKFSALPGDKYLKLHPHIKTVDGASWGALVSRTAPAEMILIDMMKKYKSVNVFHHGSSVERYISGENITFTTV